MEGDSIHHLELLLNKIKDNEPFGVIRPADGELQILQNNTLTNVDNWTFRSNGILRNHLFNAINADLKNLYVGIPCPTCNKEMFDIYNSSFNIPKERRTYSNVFVNANWKSFTNFLKEYKNGFYVITPGLKEVTEFNVLGRYIIDPYLVNSWDEKHSKETDKLVQWISSKEDSLILFSAGPLSKVWIPILMSLFPTNTYLDVGSSLDIFFKGETNRYYITDNGYATNTCDFKEL